MSYKITVSNLIFSLLCIFNLLGIFVSGFGFGYADEITSLICIVYIFIAALTKKISFRQNIIFITSFLLLIILGVLGNVFNNQKEGIFNLLLSVFFFLKPYSVLIAMCIFFKGRRLQEKAFFNCLAKSLIIILFLCALYYAYTVSFSFNSFRFALFGAFSGDIAVLTFIFLSIVYYCKDKYKFLYFVLSFAIILTTGSGLGLVGIALFFMLNIALKSIKHKRFFLLLTIIVIIALSMNEIRGYFMDTTTLRYILYKYGAITANSYFPLGSGFGTYGSYIAYNNYSFLYYQYGFNNIWGLQPAGISSTSRVFLYDMYYPMIYGEFGWIGLIVFIIMIVYVFRLLFKGNYENKFLTLSVLLFLLGMAIGFNVSGVAGCLLFGLLGIFLSKKGCE